MPDSQLLSPAPHCLSAKRRRESISSSTKTSKRSRHMLDINATPLETSSSSSPTSVASSSSEQSSSKSSHKTSHHNRADGRSRDAARSQVKKERGEAWKQWCEEHRWEPRDDPGYKQKVGSKEVHRSDAMSYFRLKDYEIDTLPYVTFDNEHNPMIPGRSYSLGNLHTLVSRKFAFLAGLDPGVSLSSQEVEFLKRGWQLFEADTKNLEERMKAKGKARKALVFGVIFIPRQRSTEHAGRKVKPRPYGSWTSRVYEDGVYMGEWLNFQFDPDEDDFADHYRRYVRFRPRDADWEWVLDVGDFDPMGLDC